MRIQLLDKFIAVLVCSVLAACAPLMEIPTSSPVATTVIPSATPPLTETPTVTKLPTEKSTTSPTPTLTSPPAPDLINPSGVISEDTVKNLELLGTLKLESFSLYSGAFSQDGSLFAVAPWEGTIKLWNVSTLEEMETAYHVNSFKLYSRSANQILVAYDDIGDIRIWDLTTGKLVYKFLGSLFWGQAGPAVSSDGSLMAVSSTGHLLLDNIVIWDLKNQKEVQTLYGDWTTNNARGYPIVDNVYFSPDASLLAAEITDGRSIVWDVASGERVIVFDNTIVHGFSHDGTMLAANVTNNLIGVYDTTTWRLVNASMYYPGSVRLFTLDDELLIGISNEYGKITFWNWKTGEPIRTIFPSIYTKTISHQILLLSPDGKLLVHCYYLPFLDRPEETTIDIWGIP